MMFCSEALAQQTGTIAGTVTDSLSGQTIPGVNVVIAGTQRGASTGPNGQYTISGLQPGTYTVRASFVGYSPETRDGVQVTAGETTQIDFALVESEIALEAVTVTALGVERQERSLTYGQQNVGSAQIAEARELNVANSLSGAVSGISVNQAATGLGGDARVILRGNRSITGNSQPLWVVDGVPIRGDVSDLDPSNIEEITVLKGPNAAALYGSEAQNGAIIITTKSGREGELQLTFSQNLQLRDPILLTDYQNQYGQGSAGEYNASAEASWGPRMEGQMVNFWSPNPERSDEQYALNPQPDNVSDAYQQGFNSTTSISATAGNESTQARFSYAYTDAEGIVPSNALERHNIQGRVNTQISDNLSLDGKLSYSREDIDNQLATGENFTNPIRHISRLPRNIRTEDAENFEYFTNAGLRRQHFWNPGSNGGANPYWTMNRNLNHNTTERVIAMTSLTYDFTDAFSLMVRGSYDGGNTTSETELFNDTYIVADNGSYSQSRSNAWEANGDFLATYSDDLFDDWSVEANFGGNIKKERGGAVSANTGQALTVPNFFTLSNTQNVVASESVGSPREVHSLYGFGQIGWRDALYLDITGRNDWSSTLPPDSRSFFYPSVGLSAVLTDLLPAFPDVVRFAKVRGSWARVGNSAPPFQTIRTASFSPGGNNGFLSLSNTLPAENLKPEETTSYEIGTDLRFFEGQRLGLNVTLYRTNTRNQLFTSALPRGSGASFEFVNGGDVENRGIEVTVTGQPVITSDFTSNIDLNFSINRSEVVRLTEDQPSLTIAQDFMREFRIVAGEPFGQVFSRGFQRDDQGRVLVGPDGMPVITDGLSVQVADFNADWRGSIRSSFSYKNIGLSFLIEHRQGGSTVSLTNAILDAGGLRERTLEGRDGGLVFGENFFSEETAVLEDGSPNDIAIDAETFWRNVGGRNAPVGEVFSEDATNTRLRQMTLSYSLPQSIINSLPVSGVNFSLVGRNLFFLYRASSNLDPDLLVGTGAAAEGFESFAPPTTRQFGFDLQIQY